MGAHLPFTCARKFPEAPWVNYRGSGSPRVEVNDGIKFKPFKIDMILLRVRDSRADNGVPTGGGYFRSLLNTSQVLPPSPPLPHREVTWIDLIFPLQNTMNKKLPKWSGRSSMKGSFQ